MPVTAIDGTTLMAFRILAGGLARRTADPRALGVLRLGIQDRDGGAALALADRLADPTSALIGAPSDDTPLALAWTLRGTPHTHLRDDLPRLAAELRPTSEPDARAMLGGFGQALATQDASALDAWDAVVSAMRDTVTAPVAKAALSTALTATLPSRYVTFCAGCQVDHVPEQLFRYAALPAGLGLVPGVRATLAPLSPAVSAPTVAAGRDALIQTYLDLYGAATKAEVAAHLGTATRELTWPDTVPVLVEGIRLQTTPDRLDRLRSTDSGAVREVVRFLPPGDPLLQPRTRSLIVPDKTRWKALWPALGPAGAVLAGGGIVGTWRPRSTGRTLRLTIDPFRPLTGPEKAALATEADLVGRVRGIYDVQVVIGATAAEVTVPARSR